MTVRFSELPELCGPAILVPYVNSSLGKNIERLRRAAGFANAAAFARHIGVSASTLNDWETGRYANLRLESLLTIAKGARCTVDELVAGSDAAYDALQRDLTRSNGADVSARDLAQQLEARTAFTRELHELANRMVETIVRAEEHLERDRARLTRRGRRAG